MLGSLVSGACSSLCGPAVSGLSVCSLEVFGASVSGLLSDGRRRGPFEALPDCSQVPEQLLHIVSALAEPVRQYSQFV